MSCIRLEKDHSEKCIRAEEKEVDKLLHSSLLPKGKLLCFHFWFRGKTEKELNNLR